MTPEEVKKLSDNELRIKVAKLCGWTEIGNWSCDTGRGRVYHGRGVYGDFPNGASNDRRALPNYPSDLNAMREAEEVLDSSQRIDFVFSLMCDVLGWQFPVANEGTDWTTDQEFTAIHASARQRAEAFVLTMEGT